MIFQNIELCCWCLFLLGSVLLHTSLAGDATRLASWLEQQDESQSASLSFTPQSAKSLASVGMLKPIAKKNLKEGELLYSLPLRESCIHPETALSDPVLGDIFREHSWELNRGKMEALVKEGKKEEAAELILLFDDQIVKLYLIYLKHKPLNEEKWGPFIEALPETFETPMYWSEEELEELKGSPLLRATRKQLGLLKKEYNYFLPKLAELYPEVFDPTVFTQEEYNWAYSVYASRNWYKSIDPSSPILPLMEAFSYADEPSVKMKLEDGKLQIFAGEDLEEGEEVLINEGLLSNRDLLEFYGFTLLKNTENTLSVGVALDDSDQLFGNKKKLLEEKGLRDQQDYPLRATEIPKELLLALRVYHANIYDWEDARNALENNVISYQNELKVCESVIDLCQSSLRKYQTSGKEDKALLKSKELTPRQRHAVILRRGEKKILVKTLDKAQNALKHVKKNWQFRSMDIPGTPEMRTLIEGDEIL